MYCIHYSPDLLASTCPHEVANCFSDFLIGSREFGRVLCNQYYSRSHVKETSAATNLCKYHERHSSNDITY